jgi:hypothetical protein
MTLLFTFLLNIIPLIFCQFDSEGMSKALACMSVISQKLNSNQPEIYSSMMLKCYITITESMSKKILVGLETGTNSLSNKEIDKLTDYMSLSSLSEKELKRKSQELENILKNFKQLQEEFKGQLPDMGDDGDFYDEDGSIDTPSNVNYFSLIPKGIFGAFNIFNNYISLFIFLLIIYLTLLMIRKINDSERKMKKKKKKKMMAKKVENDDEDDDENNDNDE